MLGSPRGDSGRGKGPPPIANVQAEAAVLGAMLLHPGIVDLAAERLCPADFAVPAHRNIFAAALAEQAAGRNPNAISVAVALGPDKELAAAGGREYLARLTSSGASIIYAGGGGIDQVAELGRRRRLAFALDDVGATLHDNGPLPSILDALDAASAAASGEDLSRPAMSFGAAYRQTFQHILDVKDGKVEPAMRVADLSDWDEVTGGGMNAGDLILLAGRPGMSKTTWSLTIARRAAEAGHGVLYISREMTTQQLMLRILADMLFEARGRAGFQEIKEGRVDTDDIRTLARLQERAEALPIMIEQPASLSSARIGPMIRRHRRKLEAKGAKLKLVIVDYLGLLEPPPGKGNRNEEVSAISRELKSAAQANDVALIALSQLSRGVESRDDKRPKLADLRDSGSLEQDADCVVFLYREAYYHMQARPDPSNEAKVAEWEDRYRLIRNDVEIYSAKVRQGSPCLRRAYFFGDRQAVRNSDFFSAGRG